MRTRLGWVLVGVSGTVLLVRLGARLVGVPEGTPLLSLPLVVGSMMVLGVGTWLLSPILTPGPNAPRDQNDSEQ